MRWRRHGARVRRARARMSRAAMGWCRWILWRGRGRMLQSTRPLTICDRWSDFGGRLWRMEVVEAAWRLRCSRTFIGNDSSCHQLMFSRVEQYTSLSLFAGPRRLRTTLARALRAILLNTLVESSTLGFSVTTAFADQLPTLISIDRSKLVRGRLDGKTSNLLNLEVLPGSRTSVRDPRPTRT